ncbi:MAG: sulfotransferase [Deltaproteobacteria bacterium]|nr:sulfotransferase [Deltaproteobacteria bacterium]
MAVLKREATKRTGFDDFGDPIFEQPLAAWVNDLINGDLNDFGRQFLRRIALSDICRRLKVIAYLAEHPEISDVEIPPLLLIMAAPRTGTTLLHNLMATHPLARTFLRWELMEPVPSPTPQTYTTDPRIAKLQASIEPLRGSLLEKMHWVNADEPEENAWGFFDCTGFLGRSLDSIVPTWSRWIQEHDHRTTFRDFRKLVQLLLWKYPPPNGGYLLLKCVLTTTRIQMFADEFPEAKFILVHRDPFRILRSIGTISEAIYRPFISGQSGPRHEDGLHDRIILKWLKMTLRALVEFDKATPERVVNIQYIDLMNDAVKTTRFAFDYLAIGLPEDLEQRILTFLTQQRSGKRLVPPKRYESFGYDEDTVWADSTVAEYCQYFSVPKEETRLTDTKTGF